MHSPSNWRAGASRTTGTIFLIYPALMYAVMFYVILNKRKRLGDCVTFSYLLSGRARALSGTYRNVSKYAKNPCAHSRCITRKARLAIVNAQAASSLRPLRGVVWGPCFMHLSSVGSLPLAKNALHSPTSIILVSECSAFLASGSDPTE